MNISKHMHQLLETYKQFFENEKIATKISTSFSQLNEWDTAFKNEEDDDDWEDEDDDDDDDDDDVDWDDDDDFEDEDEDDDD